MMLPQGKNPQGKEKPVCKHCHLMTLVLLLAGLAALTGCGESPDVEKMKAGLVRSGLPADQAACFAEKMSETVGGEPYNYMAALMGEGLNEREAVTKTRRKFGAEWLTPMREARKTCVP